VLVDGNKTVNCQRNAKCSEGIRYGPRRLAETGSCQTGVNDLIPGVCTNRNLAGVPSGLAGTNPVLLSHPVLPDRMDGHSDFTRAALFGALLPSWDFEQPGIRIVESYSTAVICYIVSD
jgi:hypothetical protein